MRFKGGGTVGSCPDVLGRQSGMEAESTAESKRFTSAFSPLAAAAAAKATDAVCDGVEAGFLEFNKLKMYYVIFCYYINSWLRRGQTFMLAIYDLFLHFLV